MSDNSNASYGPISSLRRTILRLACYVREGGPGFFAQLIVGGFLGFIGLDLAYFTLDEMNMFQRWMYVDGIRSAVGIGGGLSLVVLLHLYPSIRLRQRRSRKNIKRKRLLYKATKWTLLLTVCLWIGTPFIQIGYFSPYTPGGFILGQGAVQIYHVKNWNTLGNYRLNARGSGLNWYNNGHSGGWVFDGNQSFRLFAEFGTRHPRSFWQCDIPLWVIFLLSLLILAGLRWRTRIPPGHCLSCGYNLTGNTSGGCPECGEKIPPKLPFPFSFVR